MLYRYNSKVSNSDQTSERENLILSFYGHFSNSFASSVLSCDCPNPYKLVQCENNLDLSTADWMIVQSKKKTYLTENWKLNCNTAVIKINWLRITNTLKWKWDHLGFCSSGPIPVQQYQKWIFIALVFYFVEQNSITL